MTASGEETVRRAAEAFGRALASGEVEPYLELLARGFLDEEQALAAAAEA